MAQPTLVAYSQSTWTDNTAQSTSETTAASFTWQTGDVFHVFGAIEDFNFAFTGVPTTGGANLTFSAITTLGVVFSDCRVQYWRGTATGAGSGTFSLTYTASGVNRAGGIAVFQYRGTDGQGTPVTATGSSAKTLSVTRGQANSHVLFCGGDWNAVGDATVDPTPSTNATERIHAPVSGRADFFVNSWGDQGATGTTSYGITNHTGTVKMTMLAIEIFGTSSGGYTLTADSGSYTHTGTALGLVVSRRIDLQAGSYSISGTQLSLAYNRRLDLESGSYAIAGSNVGLLRQYPLIISAGNYSLTGTTLDLLVSRRFDLETGTYSITGSDLVLTHDHVLLAEEGSYSLVGNDLGLIVLRQLSLDSGTYEIIGTDLDLVVSSDYFFELEAGTYSLTGSDISLRYDRRLDIESGSYEVVGSSISLTTSSEYSILVEAGTYLVSGTDLSLRIDRVLNCEAGSYDISGSDLGLVKGYALQLESGSYEVTGSSLNLLTTRFLFAASGTYVITGFDIAMSISGRDITTPPERIATVASSTRTVSTDSSARVVVSTSGDRNVDVG